MYLNNIFCILNVPLPDELAEIEEQVDDIVNHELEQNYGKLDDGELDQLMEPLYDEHNGK